MIDFIDMMQSKNQRAVENRIKDALKQDRARIQVGRISRFGLLEMSRQRLRPSLGESSQITCPRCSGHGSIRSAESLALSILRIIEEEAMKEKTARLITQAPVDVGSFLLNEKRSIIHEIEERHKISVTIVPNPSMETPRFDVQRVRDADADDAEFAKPSYKMAEEPEAELELIVSDSKPRTEEPAVKSFTPATTAPPATPKPVETTKQQGPGIITRMFRSLFGSGEETVKQQQKPQRQSRGRNNRSGKNQHNNRNQNRNQQGRRNQQNRGQNRNQNAANKDNNRGQQNKNTQQAKDNANTKNDEQTLNTTNTNETKNNNQRGRRRGRRGGRRRGNRNNQQNGTTETNTVTPQTAETKQSTASQATSVDKNPAPVATTPTEGAPKPVAPKPVSDQPAPAAPKAVENSPKPVAPKPVSDQPAPAAPNAVENSPKPVAPRPVATQPTPAAPKQVFTDKRTSTTPKPIQDSVKPKPVKPTTSTDKSVDATDKPQQVFTKPQTAENETRPKPTANPFIPDKDNND